VQFVHLVVPLVQQGRGRAVALVPGIRGLAPHLGGEGAHPLDQPAAARREVVAENVVGPARDRHDQMMRAAEFRHDPQHRQQEAQVRRDRGLEQDLPVDQFLDLRVQRVDDLVAFAQHPHHVAVAVQQRPGRLGQVLGDHGEQLDDLGLDGLKLAFEFLPTLGHGQSLLARSISPPAAIPASGQGRGRRRGIPVPARSYTGGGYITSDDEKR
jgi:hypothetical protein